MTRFGFPLCCQSCITSLVQSTIRLLDNGKVTGRIAAFIDRLALETWKEPVGLFGYYECIDNLLYRALYESLYSPDTWVEINYVLEDNTMMNNAIIKLNAKPMRRYRVYEKKI